MRTYGILGYPLSHTFSPGYFKQKFEQEHILNSEYVRFEEQDISDFVPRAKQMSTLIGFNVTIPYKQAIIPLLDSISDEASWIGAVNTVRRDGEKLVGFNTDAFGFRASLEPLLKPEHKRALILGTGGASKAVQFVFDQLGIPTIYASRTGGGNKMTYEEVTDEIIKEYPIIVNTTPLGMYPKVDEKPQIPYESLSNKNLCYDLVYNPEETEFLKLAKKQGAQIKNGLEMLHLQAEKSWDIWNENLYL